MTTDKRWCTLTDEELIDNVQRHLKYICKERKVPTMHIPAQPNEDFDLTLSELLFRFKERLSND